ncbi:MAG: condensation domain-containing protein [Cyanobacteria bacterium P01_C01_bin.118]
MVEAKSTLELTDKETISHPLSCEQQALYEFEQPYPGTTVHVIGGALRVVGTIDVSLFAQAVQHVLQKHASLHLQLFAEQGQVLQRPVNPGTIDVPIHDLRGTANALSYVRELIGIRIKIPFQPLLNAVLFEVSLYRIEDDQLLFFAKIHHILTDVWSLDLLGKEVLSSYVQLKAGATLFIDSRPSYLEYVADEQRYLSSEKYQRDEDFWLTRMGAAPESSFRRVPQQLRAKRIVYDVPQVLSQLFYQFAYENSVHLSSLFITLACLYMRRETANPDVCVGAVCANRWGSHYRNVMGPFGFGFPFRTRVEQNTLNSELVKRVNSELRACYSHLPFPVGRLNQQAQLADRGYGNFYGIMVNYYNNMLKSLTIEGLEASYEEADKGCSPHALQLNVRADQTNKAIRLELIYNPELVQASQVQGFRAYLEASIAHGQSGL